MQSADLKKTPSRSELIFSFFFLTLHAFLMVILLGLLALYVPASAQVFDEFEVELPAFTIMVINLGRLASQFWYAVLFLGLIALTMDFFLLHGAGKSGSGVQSFLGITIIAALILSITAVLLGVWLPSLSIMESLQ